MTRTPQLSSLKNRPQDYQYRPPTHHPQHPPHNQQQIVGQQRRNQQINQEQHPPTNNSNSRYPPPQLAQGNNNQQQQQQARNIPPGAVHAYSTNDLFDVAKLNDQNNNNNNDEYLISTQKELLGDKKSHHHHSIGEGAEDDINLNPLNLPVYERSQSSFRWIVLLLSCWSMFGSYYCFDNPAALSNQFQDANGDYSLSSVEFNLLYSVYSIPNMILPLFGGVLVDKIGAEISMVLFLSFIAGGQAIFAFATSINSYYLMLVGRTVFGLGGESLCVAVSALLAVYFKGKEMAFALGLNLSLARAGSSLNDVATLFFYHTFNSLPFAIWCGFFLLCVCLFFTTLMVILDRLQAKKMTNRGYFVPQAHTGEIVRFRDILSFDASYWLLTISCVVVYGCVLPWNSIGSNFMVSKYDFSNSVANSYLLIPYLISAILTPLIGYIVDRIGHRAHLLMISAMSLGIAHFMFAWLSFTPIYGLIIMGLAYSIYASAIWPSIALVVDGGVVGTAYGIITAVQNTGLASIPIIVGYLTKQYTTIDPNNGNKIIHKNYKHVEMFFFGLACLGVFVGIILLIIEPKYGNRLKIPSIKSNNDNNDNNNNGNEGYGAIENDDYNNNDINIYKDRTSMIPNNTQNSQNYRSNYNNTDESPMLANDQFAHNSLDHTPQLLRDDYNVDTNNNVNENKKGSINGNQMSNENENENDNDDEQHAPISMV